MKTSIALLTLGLLLAFSTAIFAQWTSIPLPCRPSIRHLHTWQGNVYAHSEANKVYKSADGGNTWAPAFPATCFAINPYNGTFYRILQDEYRAEFSTDGGNTWANLYLNVWWPAIQQYLPVFTFYQDQVYLNFNGSLLRRSTGQPWVTVASLGTAYSRPFHVFGQHIWTDYGGSVLHSINGGASWDTAFVNHPDSSYSLVVTRDTILVCRQNWGTGDATLLRSVNQGASWTTAPMPFKIDGGLEGGGPFWGIERGSGKTWFSWNGLTGWQSLNIGIGPRAFKIWGNTKIAGSWGGVLLEKNGQWYPVLFGEGVPGEFMSAVLKKTDKHLLFGDETDGFGMAKRPDNGNDWVMSDKPYFSERTVKMGNQLIGAGKHGTYRADPAAADFEWQLINTQGGMLFGMNGAQYLCDPATELIYKSLNAGQSWTQTGKLPAAFEHQPSGLGNILAADGGRFYLRDGKKLMVSENDGASWTLRYTLNQFPANISGDISRLYATAGQVFISNVIGQEIYRSTDNGMTFSTLPAPKNAVTGLYIYRLRIYENTLYLSNGDGKFYRSKDWGQTWTKVKPPYTGFRFDAAIASNNSTGDDTNLYLYDYLLGKVWTVNPDNLVYTPCDDTEINMSDKTCWYAPNTFQISGDLSLFEIQWLQNGLVFSNAEYPFNDYPMEVGDVYVLRLHDPGSGCVLTDTITAVPPPVADLGPMYSVLPCSMEFDTLDLSGSSHYPGIQYLIYANSGTHYVNEFNAAGVPSNPNPPVVSPGWYVLRVDDTNTNCAAYDTITVERDPAQTIADYGTTWASCGQNDGTASISNNGDPGITYAWSTGATTPSISGLAPGWYSVTATNGFCRSQYNFEIKEDPACKVRIQGTAWNNTVCSTAWPAQRAKNLMLHLLPDDVYTFTDQNGFYEFTRAPGSGTVEFVDPVRFDLLCPAAGSLAFNLPGFGAVSSGNDFFVKVKPVQNTTVSATAGAVVPGFTHTINYSVCNFGDVDIPNASLVFKYDPALGDIGAPPPGFTSYDPATNTAVWDGIYLSKGYCNLTNPISIQVPAQLPIGTVLHFSMDLLPDTGDFFPADNHTAWARTAVASFDPNRKTVSPGDTEQGGKIYAKDTLLTYTVHFQNIGNYPATTVEIRDTLDDDLDVTTIQFAQTSHPYPLQMRFEGRNVLIFRFQNINLPPDSASNPAQSQGYVTFSIQRKPNLPVGTVIRNRAGIYFDFNTPVITNWVESVLSAPVGVEPEPKPGYRVSIFPNPNAGRFTVELPAPADAGIQLRIADLTGRVLLERNVETGSARQTIEAGGLPGGLYFLQIVSEEKVLAVEKFVKN